MKSYPSKNVKPRLESYSYTLIKPYQYLSPASEIKPYLFPAEEINPYLFPAKEINPYLSPASEINPYLSPASEIDPYLSLLVRLIPTYVPCAMFFLRASEEQI